MIHKHKLIAAYKVKGYALQPIRDMSKLIADSGKYHCQHSL